ncbi:MAG: hypothetical protein MJ212_03455 [Alphaproteobacteria bacterium]|nr:hypothetical protein [Alphaproteobacteria bacterium]
MAQIPYTAEIKSKKISSDLATRLQHFLLIQKLIEAMSHAGNTPQNIQELQTFGDEIKTLYNGYMNDKLSAEQTQTADKVFADEKLMDLADKLSESTDSEKKLEMVRGYAVPKFTAIALKQAGYDTIAEGNCTNTALNLPGTLFIILEKESKKIDSEDFAHRIVNGNLDTQEIPLAVNTLQAAKQKVIERLRTDWQTYTDSRTPNANIEANRNAFEDLLGDRMEINYKAYPELHNVLLCIRDDFSAKDVGSKQVFLKMVGNMLDCGQSAVKNDSTTAIRKNTDYNDFIKLVKQQYPNDSDNVINTMLGINANTDTKEVEKLRREAFEKKSKELYCKFVSAVLVKKYDQNNDEHTNNFDYQQYIDVNIAGYISDMKKNGENNIANNLHLVDERKASSLKDIIDDTAENQIISVHHKTPVASVVPIYVKLHPELHKDTLKIRDFINEIKKRCPNAAEKYTENDLLTIGFGLSVFPEESKKDKPSDILKITDEKKRTQARQTLANKNAIYDLYQQYFPLSDVDKLKAKEEILRMANDPSEHMLPIGKDVHQNSEPNGHIIMIKQNEQIVSVVKNVSKLTGKETIEKVNDMTILSAQYEKSKLEKILPKLKSTFNKALAEYNRTENSIITQRVIVKFPETKFIQKVRENLNSNRRGLTIDSIRQEIGLAK